MNTVKELVSVLHLDKYYGDFKRDDESYRFYVEIYAFKVQTVDGEVTYIGNRQRPSEYVDTGESKYSLADYWLNGNSNAYTVIHRFDQTSNSLFRDGSGNKLANQKLLNTIKSEVVDLLKPNFNVQIMPTGYDLQEQFAKNISNYKKAIRNTIVEYQLDDFVNDLVHVIDCIKDNYVEWHKALIINNRYWMISIADSDAKERERIHWDDLTESQKIIVIVLKEWLAMIVNESFVSINYSMHIDKLRMKLTNSRFKNYDLFNSLKSRLFEHKTAIKLILSTLYSSSSQYEIENVYKKFMKWRDNYNTKIFR